MNEMESVEGSLKQMGENVSAVQTAAVPGLAQWGQDKLDDSQSKWETLSKKVKTFIYLFAICAVMSCKKYGFLVCVNVVNTSKQIRNVMLYTVS